MGCAREWNTRRQRPARRGEAKAQEGRCRRGGMEDAKPPPHENNDINAAAAATPRNAREKERNTRIAFVSLSLCFLLLLLSLGVPCLGGLVRLIASRQQHRQSPLPFLPPLFGRSVPIDTVPRLFARSLPSLSPPRDSPRRGGGALIPRHSMIFLSFPRFLLPPNYS